MNAFRCRSPYRSFDHSLVATSRVGFRVAMDAEQRRAAEDTTHYR
jgi:hypothetical protein